jgi:hypothetical protein
VQKYLPWATLIIPLFTIKNILSFFIDISRFLRLLDSISLPILALIFLLIVILIRTLKL